MGADPTTAAGKRRGRAGHGDGTAADSSAAATAVTALYQQHAVGLVRLAIIMLGDRAAAEDVVQDAFFGLYRNWGRLGDQSLALVYTRSAVLNRCRNALRDQARRGHRDYAAGVGTSLDMKGPQASPGQPSCRWAAVQSAESAVLVTEDSRRMLAAIRMLRSHSNGAVVPPSSPVFVPAGSVPRYFAELDPVGNQETSPSGLLVADTYTGKKIATITPPAGITFTSVSAASDDRTFVLFATPSGPGTHSTGTWYELRIAPGTAHPAALTRLPVSPLPRVVAMAVSGSGRELAVVQSAALESQPDVLSIYSLATGGLLHSWSTPYLSGVLPDFASNATGPLANWPVLTWVDDDRGITFPGQPSGNAGHLTWTMRQLDVTAAGSSLAADSRVVWTDQGTSGKDKYGCDLENPLAVSPDGRTFVCASGTGEANGQRLMKWLTYASGVNASGRLLYQTESNMGSGSSGYSNGMSDNDVVLWTNQSGSTAIALWYRFSSTGTTAVHFGVISDGRFFPLPATLITAPTIYAQTSIAW